MAPGLSDCVRKVLEQQKVPSEDIDLYLGSMKSLKRYDLPFRKLWALMELKGIDIKDPTVQSVASGLIQLNLLSQSEARNAYSACLLIPGFQSLRFNPLLTPVKKLWNKGGPKYASFWDASPVLQHLAEPDVCLSTLPLPTLRERLTMATRLLSLYRGVDLARTQRTLSFIGADRPFLLVQRKGWQRPRWEEVLSLPSAPQISPWHLISEYVARTSAVVPGGAFTCQFGSPFQRFVVRRY